MTGVPNQTEKPPLPDDTDRITALAREMADLRQLLGTLAGRVAHLEQAGPAQATTAAREAVLSPAAATDEEGFWHWLGTSSVLPRLAAISFLLVVALTLRVLTDSGTLGLAFGSFLGIAYTLALIVAGDRLLTAGHRLGPVFPVCGAFLLYSIVLETHGRFATLSSGTSYALLALSVLLIVRLGLRHQLAGLTALGLLGGCFSSLAIDFLYPDFPALLLFLLFVHIVASLAAARQPASGWTRGLLFFATAVVWLLWTSRLRVVLARHQPVPAELFEPWFLPLVFAYAVTFLTAPALALRRREVQWASIYDMFLPTAGVILTHAVAWTVTTHLLGHAVPLGLVATAMGGAHLAVAAWLYRRGLGNGGVCVFTCSGAIQLALALPAVTGSLVTALPVWAVMAFGLTRLSGICEIGGIRLLSYFLQAAACVVGGFAGLFAVSGPHRTAGMVVAAFLAMVSGLQHRWVRHHPISCSRGFFARVDPRDRSATLLFLTTVLSAFLSLQIAAALLLASAGATAGSDALSGIQSVLINGSAIGLMLFGLKKRNSEFIIAAVAATLLGAVKVFGHDLLQDHGIARVASIFTFGLVAAVGSMVMSRWQQLRRDGLTDPDLATRQRQRQRVRAD